MNRREARRAPPPRPGGRSAGTGHPVRQLEVRLGLAALGRHRAEIDALNVFPIPDGDTGTNLFLTFESAAEALREAGAELDMRSTVVPPAHPRAFPAPLRQGVTFEDVGFRYPGKPDWALRHLSFALPAGETLAEYQMRARRQQRLAAERGGN